MTSIQLTAEQQHVVDANADALPLVIDPRTNKCYVLVSAEQYQRLQTLLDPSPISEVERRTILAGVWKRAHWDDPCMNDYDALDPRKKP